MHKAATYLAQLWLIILIATGLLAPILSTNKPWIVKYGGEWLFPAFSTIDAHKILPEGSQATDWKLQAYEYAIWAPCTYLPGNTDWINISVSPFDKQKFVQSNDEIIELPNKFRHWLGTNHKGEDVLAAVIWGCRNSLAVGIFSMILAGSIGVVLGLVAGYYQNQGITISLGKLIGGLIGIIPALFYGLIRPSMEFRDESAQEVSIWYVNALVSLFIFISLWVMFFLVGKWSEKKFPLLKRSIAIPIDALITRITEWMNALPKLLLILILAGLFNKTAIGLIIILGFIQWTGIARIVRAETLSLRQTIWTESAISLGLSDFRILSHHLLPHILPIFMVVFILGIANSIMAESALSFLDAGVPDNWISWGTLLGDGIRYLDNWWLLVVPGIVLFTTLLSLSFIAEQYRRNKK